MVITTDDRYVPVAFDPLASRKHSPSLDTLRKHAQACGKSLTIGIA